MDPMEGFCSVSSQELSVDRAEEQALAVRSNMLAADVGRIDEILACFRVCWHHFAGGVGRCKKEEALSRVSQESISSLFLIMEGLNTRSFCPRELRDTHPDSATDAERATMLHGHVQHTYRVVLDALCRSSPQLLHALHQEQLGINLARGAWMREIRRRVSTPLSI